MSLWILAIVILVVCTIASATSKKVYVKKTKDTEDRKTE
jgi:flagellar basal body-associated protein FliL